MHTFNVNGKAVNLDVEDDMPLLWALRDELGMTGTKFGCGIAACGACTVHIDGVATRSCVMPVVAVAGKSVQTIESQGDPILAKLQAAWVEHQVPQCGYCQPGMIMAAAALLESNGSPSDAEIDAAITNICRCGTYPRIRRAIGRAARIRRGEETVAAAPPPGIDPADAARAVPALDSRPAE